MRLSWDLQHNQGYLLTPCAPLPLLSSHTLKSRPEEARRAWISPGAGNVSVRRAKRSPNSSRFLQLQRDEELTTRRPCRGRKSRASSYLVHAWKVSFSSSILTHQRSGPEQMLPAIAAVQPH